MRQISLIFLGIFLLFTSCVDQTEQFIEDYGIFINNVESDYADYTEKEWAEAELTFEEFKLYPSENDLKLSQHQIERMQAYETRFNKVAVQKDPSIKSLINLFR